MNKLLKILVAPVLLLSCVCKNKTTGDTTTTQDIIMYTVTGKAEIVGVYCGGARPTQEMMEQITQPKPLAKTTFYIRQDSVNDISKPIYKEFTTDSLGNFSIQLPAGKYSIVNTEKKNSDFVNGLKKTYAKETENYSAIDLNCIKEWVKTPDAILNVNGDVKNFTITYSEHCSWHVQCVAYKGPYPP